MWEPSSTLSFYAQASTATDPANGLLGSTAPVRETELAKARQIEVGAKGDVTAVNGQWSVAVYRIEKRNLLAIDAVSGLTQQVGKQSSEGVELALTMAPARGWTVDTNVAILRARFDDFSEKVGNAIVSRDGNTPPNVPRRLANLWTHYRFSPAWRAGIGLQYVGPRTGDNANLTFAPGYALLDASVSYQPLPALSFDLALRNLADKTYAVALANNGAQWLLGSPRSIELTARYAF
jgi:iron complex outermembrane receptor protein